MTEKKKPKTKAAVKTKTDEEMAALLTNPRVQAALTLQTWQELEQVGIHAYIDELSTQIDKVNADDMKRPEDMLLMQAHTLDGLFNNLAQKAHCQTHMPHYESFLRLAFKAQGQCRSTLETLAAIKNPPVIYAKQANISNGYQQINNGITASQAEKNQNQQNELLTELPHETLDNGRTRATIEVNKAMAALE